ncbi:EAL domain-containing protein [Actimicrobium sp. CCC2.4]|uniref:EAL domain-containing protein n=1 Tax=Actimicrobium sp. CCC2.4 TaxID=3048606 RepID=UPI002AC9DD4A|nr:EAL domain-containing protein [Actimicrobium sp. CCC2.4]MEB0136482.1 EAL domain-containing protein [Actimicrobium sp. CCC2.4]WPX30842.1 EAL domain-containing protein [Actimicrobium sp. CCC2.4]
MATILIVDDHVLNREFLSTLLGYGGHQLLEARDGVEGMKVMRAARPDLVIVDIVMPNMDGYEFVTAMQNDPDIAQTPAIFYTASYREREATIMAQACNVRWVLPKPSEPGVILKTVHEALGLPMQIANYVTAGITPGERAGFARVDNQLVDYLVDLEISSNLIARLAQDDVVLLLEAKEIREVAERLSVSLASLQEVSLHLTALVDLGIELAAERKPLSLLESGCRVAVNICRARSAVVAMYELNATIPCHLVTRGIDASVKRMLTFAPASGTLAALMAGGPVVCLAGLSGNPQEAGLPDWHSPVHSFLGVPVASRDHIHGWLYLLDKVDSVGFSEGDRQAAATVAAQLAVSYENLQLYAQIQAQHQLLTAEMAQRLQAQESLSASLRARTVMARCNQVMVRAIDEANMLDQMCQTVVDTGGYRMAWIAYAGPDGELYPVAQSGAHDVKLKYFPSDWIRDEQAWTPAATALRTGVTGVVSDVMAILPLQAWQEQASGRGYRCAISMPLLDDGVVFGVVTICAGHAHAFDASQIDMFEELACDIAYGVIHLRNKDRRVTAERSLLASEEKLSEIMGSIDNVVWSHSGTHLLYLSPIVKQVYGRPAEDFFADAKLWYSVIHPDDAARVRNRRGKLLLNGSVTQEFRILRPDGSIRWIEDRAKAVCDASGAVVRFDGVEIDITGRKEDEARFVHMANHDALTGLANRNLLSDRLAQAMLQARRTHGLLALLFMDLDHFKEINDNGGHLLGDLLLKAVAARLLDTIRDNDTVARQGGDEFIVLLANLHTQAEVVVVVDKILAAFIPPFQVEGHNLVISVSVGVTVFPSDSDDMPALLRNADTAMYRAKSQDGISVQYYSKEMGALSVERSDLEARLRLATEHREFTVFYQPKVNIDSQCIIGVEALIRWPQADGSMISPALFIPVAEEIGLITQIGEWVLRTACIQNKAWQDAGLPRICVAVNLSARQFMQPGLLESVSRALRDSGLDACHLELELTESIMMNSAEHFITTLHALKSLGVQLSIDDFGTGYSSLSYLKRFPIDRLKIDQSFIRDIATDPGDATITRAVIALGHSLNLKVIAEGVETAEQLAFLRANQCDEIQGYYFSRPVAAAALAGLLEMGAG